MRLSHSYSSIKLHEQCPKKYYHLRVAKDVKEPQGEAAAYGDWLHKQFELFVRDGKALPDTLKCWAPVLEKFQPLQPFCEMEIVLNEHLDVVGGWFHPEAWLRTKIDLCILRNDWALVGDYKSGQATDKRGNRKADYDQIEINALCLFKKYPELQGVKGFFLWTQEPDGIRDQCEVRREQANGLWAKHLQRIKQIHICAENDNWPAKTSGLCRWRTGQCAVLAAGKCVYGGR